VTDDADVPDFPDINRHQQASWNAMGWLMLPPKAGGC
jgi:hypothetical protein